MAEYITDPFSLDNSLLDSQLAAKACSGDGTALEQLVFRHQNWVFNISLRMIGNYDDATDISQEIMIKMITSISSYKGMGKFSSWLYRIAVNTIRDFNRSKNSFRKYGISIDSTPDIELSENRYMNVENKILEEEILSLCLLGMLLCLSTSQRIVFILGGIFSFPQNDICETLKIKPHVFRKRLQRAREQLSNFMNERCGLVNSRNHCQCRLKIKPLIESGLVDPNNLIFNKNKYDSVISQLPRKVKDFSNFYNSKNMDLFLKQPFYKTDASSYIHNIISNPNLEKIFSLD